jgi:tetratricopeptide (TPR) repeat protein
VQLVSVRDGAELWAGKFDDESTNFFAVQDSISEQVARALKVDWGGQEPPGRPTENAEAYRLYLLGRYWWNKRDDSNIKAPEYYQRAIALDPNFALAYAALADSYAFHSYDSQDWRRGEDAARKALEIDPTLAEAHASLGFIAMFHRWEWATAEKELQQSIELNPNYATAHQWYATLHEIRKQWPEAHAELARALEIDPTSVPLNADRCELLYFERRYDEAVGQCQRVLEMDANFRIADEHLHFIYSKLGRDADAVDEFFNARGESASAERETPQMRGFASAGARGFWQKEIDNLKPKSDQPNADYYVALYCTLLGEKDRALSHLDRALDNHNFLLPFVDAEPLFDGLRDDARFQTFLRRMGLPS